MDAIKNKIDMDVSWMKNNKSFISYAMNAIIGGWKWMHFQGDDAL